MTRLVAGEAPGEWHRCPSLRVLEARGRHGRARSRAKYLLASPQPPPSLQPGCQGLLVVRARLPLASHAPVSGTKAPRSTASPFLAAGPSDLCKHLTFPQQYSSAAATIVPSCYAVLRQS